MESPRPGGRRPAARASSHAHAPRPSLLDEHETPFLTHPSGQTPGKGWVAGAVVEPAAWPAWTDAPFDQVVAALAVEGGAHV